MSSSSNPGGARRDGGSSPYSRFIPREELGPVSAWNPGAFAGTPRRHPMSQAAAPEPAVPAEPTAAQWQAQVAAARQAGYQDGYRDGLVALEGFKQSYVKQMSAQLGRLVESFDRELDAMHCEIAGSVARTAVQLAQQVLRQHLEDHPPVVARVAAEAVEAVLMSARHITVQVHPQDLPLVAEGAAEALQARGARLLAHPGIERGGCRVESDVGAVDARIGTRWSQAAAMLGSDEPWLGDQAPAS